MRLLDIQPERPLEFNEKEEYRKIRDNAAKSRRRPGNNLSGISCFYLINPTL